MASILLGNVRGPQGDTGATGPKGDTGNAATVSAGSVTTVPYGQNARVINSGNEHNAIFDFVIPQGRPGEQTTDMQNLTLSSMTEPSEQFPIPAIGETGKVIFGKITKWFSDMAALVATKFNASNVVNNLTTTSSGYALDARQGKELKDAIPGEFLGGVSTLPTGLQNGLVGFSLTASVTVGGTTLPAGTRVFGTCFNTIGHFIGIANGSAMYMIRYAAGSWEMLGVK